MAKTWKIAGMVFLLLAADALNLGVFYMGNPAGLLHQLVTLGYTAAWVCFMSSSRTNRRCMGFALICSGLTATTAALCLIVRAWGSSGLLLIPTLLCSALFMTPFYGLDAWLPGFDGYYVLLFFLDLIWLGCSLHLFRRANQHLL